MVVKSESGEHRIVVAGSFFQYLYLDRHNVTLVKYVVYVEIEPVVAISVIGSSPGIGVCVTQSCLAKTPDRMTSRDVIEVAANDHVLRRVGHDVVSDYACLGRSELERV